MKTIEKLILSLLLLLLAALTTGAVFSWQYNYYIAYSFFILWGVAFIYYMLVLRNIYSLVLFGFMAGALGLYFTIMGYTKAEPALLLGKISLTLFTATLAIRLYRIREQLENNAILFMGLIVLLLLQVVMQNTSTEQQLEAVSLSGFANYFTVGLVANILLNDNYSRVLKPGEQKILLMQVLFCLYNISLMLIYNFG